MALSNVEFKKLVGYVEVDETYVGGKAKNKQQDADFKFVSGL
ncbi:MAG: hypothetical protein ABIU05_11725 [Nitrospirales bacterium]